jgi:hypothetical protein
VTRRLTRRDALAVGGAVALATLAGCSDVGSEPRFWDDPPSLDTDGITRALDAPVPETPRLVPVDFDPAVAAALDDRIDRLLGPIPEPLTATTLPNGEIRERIRQQRAAAREARPAPDESLQPLRAAERYATARDRAATAVGTWAGVTVEGDPEDVTADIGTVRRRAFETLDALPGPAADPLAGAAAYGPIERWYDESRRRTLVGGAAGVEGRANPLRAGESVGDVERVQSYVDAGRHLSDRYRASLADPQSVEEPLREAAERLGASVRDRLRGLHGSDADLRSNPGAEAFLDERPVARDAPSVSLLSNTLHRTFEDLRFDPVPVDDRPPENPATALTRTALALVRLRGLDAVASRIETGDTLFPEDRAAVREARDAAVDSAASLAASENPLDRWLAARVLPLFDGPDARLAATDPDARDAAEAFTEYRWIETVARESTSVAASVAESIEA